MTPTAPAPTVTGTLAVRCRCGQAVALTPDARWGGCSLCHRQWRVASVQLEVLESLVAEGD